MLMIFKLKTSVQPEQNKTFYATKISEKFLRFFSQNLELYYGKKVKTSEKLT
jgi:hypothetical protein